MSIGASAWMLHRSFYLLFSQRCAGKYQYMAGAGRDSSYDPVCIIALRSFSLDTERHLEKDETALSPIVGVRCNAVTDGLLFIPIRGGFTVSTMNTGKVYFSSNQRLNHAAINPAFSLMESLSNKKKDFGKQYRFMEAAQADELIKESGRSVSAGQYCNGSRYFTYDFIQDRTP